MTSPDFDRLFDTITERVLCHSPSSAEAEINHYLLNQFRELRQVATAHQIPLQLATISGFGSDGSIAMKNGHVLRAACLSFPTQNTHGYEIAHLGAIVNCIELLSNCVLQNLVD